MIFEKFTLLQFLSTDLTVGDPSNFVSFLMLLEIFLKYSIIYPSLQKFNCNNIFLEESFHDSFLFIHYSHRFHR